MAKLPFVVQPRLQPIKEIVGTEASGKIEIERRGYLTAAEKAFMQSQTAGDNSTQLIVNLCRQVATSYKIDMNKAYEILVDVMAGKTPTKRHEAISDEFGDDVVEILTNMSQTQEMQRILKAHCMLMYRVDMSFQATDTVDLHPELLQALAELYDDEEARSTQRLEDALGEDAKPEAGTIEILEKK